MFCKNCGTVNLATANYCINDGTWLKRTPVKFRLKEYKASFCSHCGGKTTHGYNYCTECGSSNLQYSHDKGFSSPKELKNRAGVLPKNLPGFRFTYFKNALLPALIAILIVFGLSFSVMKTSEKVFNSLVGDSLDEMDMDGLMDEVPFERSADLPRLDKMYGISDIVMASILQNPVITVAVDGAISGDAEQATVEAEAKNGFIIYLLIPFIGLFVAGIIASRRKLSSKLKDHLINAIGIAVIYALFMTIFSLFAGYSYDFNTDQKNFELSLEISTDYSFFRTFMMTLIFGFFFSGLGSLFAVTFRKTTGLLAEWIPSGEAIHQAIVIPIRGILLFSVGIFAFISSKIGELKEVGSFFSDTPFEELIDKSYMLIATVSVQLGSYLWNILHFTPITLTHTESGVEESLSYGIFSGVEPEGNALFIDDMLAGTDFDLYLMLATLIPIALFIWAGYKIARNPDMIKNLVIFSVVYAVLMSLLAAFTDLGFSLSGERESVKNTLEMSLELGFGPVGTFIKSLIFSFVFALAGTFIHKLKKNH
ncbi:zinc ribbon domain-containing protein [Bacillus sp. sid0103]|uniref:zinc ribbon domain-containing protein n=1 Tax=Bacillus sp. sid0103 TaxID=2856337 RepID=UPI001C44E092|nr:zinc ribbon domain-containing protein [Bacillus sp. sid0103]MBV7507659.1 zinc ribbon domain-containing protein [Bacillus sp. sid0103]